MFLLNQFHNAEISGNLLKLIGMKFRKVSTIASQIISLIKMYIFILQKNSESCRYIRWINEYGSISMMPEWLKSDKFWYFLFSILSKTLLVVVVVVFLKNPSVWKKVWANKIAF